MELLGYVAFAAGLLLAVLNLEFAIAFFLAAVGLGALLSAAVFLEELRLERYPRWRDLLKLTAYSVLENFGYGQVNTFLRVTAIDPFCARTYPGELWSAKASPLKTFQFLKRATRLLNSRKETMLR